MNGPLLGDHQLQTIKLVRSKSLLFIQELKECARSGDLPRGRIIHRSVLDTGHNADVYVSNALVYMYSKCGSLSDARQAFDAMDHRSAVSWNSLLLGYAKDRAGKGGGKNARHCNLNEAWIVFDRMPCHSVVAWTDIIQGFAENGREETALDLFSAMEARGCEPDARTFQAAFKACGGLAARGSWNKSRCLERAIDLHSRAACSWDALLANSVVDLYAKCGSLDRARVVFQQMPQHGIISWNAMMLGCCENGEEDEALELFESMRARGCCLDDRTFVAAIKACAARLGKPGADREEVFRRGAELRDQAVAAGCGSNIFIAASVVNLFSKCGKMVEARRVFDEILDPDVVSWSALILGYAENGQASLALDLFARMQQQANGAADSLAFVSALKACSRLASLEDARVDDGAKIKASALEQAMAIHAQVVKNNCELDVFVASMLVDVYAKCGSSLDARRMFDRLPLHNVVSWNALMLGYCDDEQNDMVLLLFKFMLLEGCVVDAGSFIPPLKALVSLASTEEKSETKALFLSKTASLHAQAAESGFDRDPRVASCLIDSYAKSGSFNDARRAFDRIEHCDPVLCTSLIVASSDAGELQLALDLYRELIRDWNLDAATFSAAINACTSEPVAMLESGRRIHADICRCGLEGDRGVVVSLVDFYAKSSCMDDSRIVFDATASMELGTVTWNALLAGYSRQGDARQVLELFRRMCDEGLRPDGSTFVSVLTAASGGGLVDEGRKIFAEMETRFGVRAGIEHHVCLVDVLSRGNRMEEAMQVLRSMHGVACNPKSSSVAWTVLLSGCNKWKNVELAREAFEVLSRNHVASSHPAVYNLMANVCQ